MNLSLFIAQRLKFKGGLAMVCIAISYLVMILAVSISSGFRLEIRNGLSVLSGDIQLTPPNLNVLDQSRPIESDASYLPYVLEVEGVESVIPVVYMAGIIKQNDDIHGVLFKGVPDSSGGVSIPRRLADMACLSEGSDMTAYFVGDKIRARKFEVASVYDSLVEADDKLIVYADIAELQRLCGWASNQVSAMEILLDNSRKGDAAISEAAREVGYIVNAYSSESESPVIATSSVSRYSQLFDWLDLIDFNVLFILVLMTVVAGFNMISGLLIMLFDNISTIGLLKSLGMNDRSISGVFLTSASVLVFKGMLAGNALAMAFCLVQDKMHILKLDPSNYFVSYVPVNINVGAVLLADIVSYTVIMLLLLLPTIFISRIDPAQTVRVK